ncbi:MAG: outer membrane protein assembly factor BamE [Alphaproteobacteria bacterium]|nr:outer membrane protein assembly factor BamE [Alphaproteobacteria bacterium]
MAIGFRGKTASRMLGMAFILGLMTACTPQINHRGYYPKAGAFAQVQEGMSKTEVEGILGSPSTTASVNFQGDSYYYITSTTVSRSFLTPVETNREVIAVRFSKSDQVTSTAQYGLQDGRVIDINTRKTPVVGSELTLLQELLHSLAATTPGLGGSDSNLKRKF